jgi:glyoxylase-like metal-dependent hydrolase (beta-lactamase superfamily II)
LYRFESGSLRVEGWECGPLATNAWLLHDVEARRALIIDPAIHSEAALKRALELCAAGFGFDAIWNTHGHFDHVYDNARWKAALPAPAPLWLHSGDAFFLEHLREQSLWFGLPAPESATPDRDWNGVARTQWAGRGVQVLHTPGHSPGSVSFLFAAEEILISGDVLFQNSIGRADLPGADPQVLARSLQVLAALPPQTRVLPGHGEPTTIGQELQDNPYLRGLSATL